MQKPRLLRPKNPQKKLLAFVCLILLFTPHCTTRKNVDGNAPRATVQSTQADSSTLGSYIRSVFRLSRLNPPASSQPGSPLERDPARDVDGEPTPTSLARNNDPLGIAHRAFEMGDYATALHEYQNIHATSDGDPILEIRLAALLSGLGQWQASCEHAEHAIDLQPGWVDAQLIQSDCLLRTGQVDSAIQSLESALASKPNDPRIRESLLAAYLFVAPESIITLPPWDSNHRLYEPVSWWYPQAQEIGAAGSMPLGQVSLEAWPKPPAGAQITLQFPPSPAIENTDVAQVPTKEPAEDRSVVIAERSAPLQPITNEKLNDPIAFTLLGDFFVPARGMSEWQRLDPVEHEGFEEAKQPAHKRDPFRPPPAPRISEPAKPSPTFEVRTEGLSQSPKSLPEVDWIIRPTDYEVLSGPPLLLPEPVMDSFEICQWNEIPLSSEADFSFPVPTSRPRLRPLETGQTQQSGRTQEALGSHGGFIFWETAQPNQKAPEKSLKVPPTSTRSVTTPQRQEHSANVKTELSSSSPIEVRPETVTDESTLVHQNGLFGTLLVAAGVVALGLVAGLGAFWVIVAVFVAVVFTLGITLYTLNLEESEKGQRDRI